MSNFHSNYKDIHKQIATADFTDEQIQELITALQTKRSAKSKLTKEEKVFYQCCRERRSYANNQDLDTVVCPICGSVKVIKNGTRNSRQRYFCKDCKKTFGDTNGTVAFRSKMSILGLMWDCVYLDETPRIDVRRAVRFIGNDPVVSTTLKSKAAKRTIPIPPQLVDCLKQQKEVAKTAFVMESNGKAPLTKIQYRRLWDLVAKRQAKDRVYYRYINGVKTPFKVEAKLGAKSKHGNCVYSIDFEVTPHILRHTYVSNLLLAGVDIKTVQYLAGHEKSKTTLDIYAHLAYNKPEDTIIKVRRAFDTDTKPPS